MTKLATWIQSDGIQSGGSQCESQYARSSRCECITCECITCVCVVLPRTIVRPLVKMPALCLGASTGASTPARQDARPRMFVRAHLSLVCATKAVSAGQHAWSYKRLCSVRRQRECADVCIHTPYTFPLYRVTVYVCKRSVCIHTYTARRCTYIL